MNRRSLSLIALLLIVSAMPLSAAQFIEQSFDQVAREAEYVVRGSVVNTWSAWDDAHEVIYTYATVRVTRYFGEIAGPDTLMVREVGGTVDGYTQEAIGFPAIRRGENVVLFLSKWADSDDLRIHAYNQGKYLVRMRAGSEVLVSDPVKQGEERVTAADRHGFGTDAADENGLSIEEFAGMVEAARAAEDLPRAQRRQ
ncbi:MAG TPA: hypothetical protein VFV49_10575 [Thermoanaerobaculia bacterium]|nr:hypothetical protein [Thermoanaerobaculia bacterium]